MELEHDFTVSGPGERVWAKFLDLEDLASCFPGATVSEVTDDGFTGTAKVKLGPIAMVYAGTGRWLERDGDAWRMVLEAKGKDKRGNGTAGAMITIVLAEEAPNRTFVHVLTDLNVTGKPAQFGRGVMQDVSDKLLGQFVTCLESRFSVVEAESLTPEPGAAPEGGPAVTAPTLPRAAAPHAAEALDLGSAVVPVVLRTYGPAALAGLVGFVIGYFMGRRRR